MPQTPTAFDQLRDYLKEMFQFQHNDLDFGIFRILRLKRRYIEQFIDGEGENDLRAIVQRELAGIERADAVSAAGVLAGYLMRNVESLRSVRIYLEGETRVFYPDFVLWVVDSRAGETCIVFFDPKGQTGITDPATLEANEKVRVATSGHLSDLARELERHH